jgi:hypothetical protein
LHLSLAKHPLELADVLTEMSTSGVTELDEAVFLRFVSFDERGALTLRTISKCFAMHAARVSHLERAFVILALLRSTE